MPEIVMHHFFARRVYDQLPRQVVSVIRPEIYRIGARGPDPLGIIRFWWPPVWKREHRKSSTMHLQKSGNFFQTLAMAARDSNGQLKDELFSYLCGFLTHYFLDSICHPYIIYRTGLGKGTEGNHRSLEHALDRDILREHRLSLKDRPITKKILPFHGLPETMMGAVNEVYHTVFGWENMWTLINTALQDERRFLRLMEDPGGKLYRLLSFSNSGTLHSLSYAEQAYVTADIWNSSHEPWCNPYDEAIMSAKSLTELEEEAFRQVMTVIPLMFDHLFNDLPYPDAIGNRTYESGLDTEDPRNQKTLLCYPLARQGRSICSDRQTGHF